jgi:hypothetical protein
MIKKSIANIILSSLHASVIYVCYTNDQILLSIIFIMYYSHSEYFTLEDFKK